MSALPALAEVLHERLAHEEMLKGRLALGPMTTKLSAGNAARWFAAATAEIRGEDAAEPIDDAGAARLVKLTRQLMLTAGDPLVARFFDFAVEDLYRAPGLTDDAIAELAEFRRLIQRSGPQERRAPTTELSKAAAHRGAGAAQRYAASGHRCGGRPERSSGRRGARDRPRAHQAFGAW